MKSCFTSLFVLLFTFYINAQQPAVSIQWQKTIGGNSFDNLNCILQTRDKGYFLGGESWSNISGDKTENNRGQYGDYWVIKLDSAGAIQWQRTIGGKAAEVIYSADQTTDGGFILGGYSRSNISGEKNENCWGISGLGDYWVVKIDAFGTIQWQRTIGGTGNDVLYSLQQTIDGGYVLGGSSASGISGQKTENIRGGNDYWVVKLDGAGNIQWQKTIGGNGGDGLSSIIQTPDGGYILGGDSESGISGEKTDSSRGRNDYWVVKLAATGDIQWQKTIGGFSYDYFKKISLTQDGGYILGGYSESGISGEKKESSRGETDYWVVKLDAGGAIEWEKTIGGSGHEEFSSLLQAKDGGYLLGGSSISNISGEKIENSRGPSVDYWIVKLNALGLVQWQKTLGGQSVDWLRAFQQTEDGGYILGGDSQSDISDDKSENHKGISDYWIIKIREAIMTDTIQGQVFIGLNNNCVQETGEAGLRNFFVRATPSDYYGQTDSAGFYQILTDTGSYLVEQIIPQHLGSLYKQLCPANEGHHTIKFNEYGKDTSGINFSNEVKLCPYLTVDINGNRRRRCFRNTTVIRYCNEGLANGSNVVVHVQLAEYMNLVSADKPYSRATDGHYIFTIGNLAAGECGSIYIVDSVSCIQGITGLTQCTKAWITPENRCVNDSDSTNWDHSSIKIAGTCMSDTLVRFVITNTGSPMQGAGAYRIYADGMLGYSNIYRLTGGDSLVMEVKANGQTMRLEADQRPGHPGSSHPNAVVESCGTNSAGTVSTGFVNQQAQDDADVEVEEQCLVIRDSYDPNDKRSSPEGVTGNHYVPHGVPLDYQIDFQNTGTDTAYKIVVVDTLSSSLDIATIQWGASSHPYVLEVNGKGAPVLKFTFNHVNLPDSGTNEAMSHGFVKFKITPYATTQDGKVVNNYADIYFDYNTPVRTNDTWVTISNFIPTGATLDVKIINKIVITTGSNVRVYPNPFNSFTIFEIPPRADNADLVVIYDGNGRIIKKMKVNGQTKLTLYRTSLSSGLYYYKVFNKNGNEIDKGKLVIAP